MATGELTWATRNYGTEGQHSAPDQKWEVTVSGDRTVAINFALFANKHLLKPSSDPNVTQEQKAAKLRLKRARAPEVAKVHHKQKYGDVAHTNTAIDLSKIELKTVVEKFAQALVAAQAAAGRWKPGDKKSVTVDLGHPEMHHPGNRQADHSRECIEGHGHRRQGRHQQRRQALFVHGLPPGRCHVTFRQQCVTPA